MNNEPSAMNHKTIIIDDEPPAREVIRNFLGSHPEIEILGDFADGFSGLKAIQDLKPDLVFLDVQMPKLTGFEMLELLEDPPVIIFSTAYDQYAIRAFEMNAVDYLLKPYSQERFNQAVGKALTQMKSGLKQKEQVQAIVNTAGEREELLHRVAVRMRHRVHVIPVDEIIFLEADGDYVTIHTGDKKFLKEKTMKYFEAHLDPGRFIRIHRSYIINVDFMDKIEYYDKENYAVRMKNGVSLRASTSGYKTLKDALKL
jgi:two-component system LytT family response regulator